jgi:hypothetical protein
MVPLSFEREGESVHEERQAWEAIVGWSPRWFPLWCRLTGGSKSETGLIRGLPGTRWKGPFWSMARGSDTGETCTFPFFLSFLFGVLGPVGYHEIVQSAVFVIPFRPSLGSATVTCWRPSSASRFSVTYMGGWSSRDVSTLGACQTTIKVILRCRMFPAAGWLGRFWYAPLSLP